MSRAKQPSPYGRPAWGPGSLEAEGIEEAQGRAQAALASLLWQLRRPEVAGLVVPPPILEHRFHPERRWRFDLAWPDRLLAVEVDGGGFVAGHHSRGVGMDDDAEKITSAVALGWRVARVTPRLIRDGRALTLVIAALQWKENPREGS